jgi:hypothetical protein
MILTLPTGPLATTGTAAYRHATRMATLLIPVPLKSRAIRIRQTARDVSGVPNRTRLPSQPSLISAQRRRAKTDHDS